MPDVFPIRSELEDGALTPTFLVFVLIPCSELGQRQFEMDHRLDDRLSRWQALGYSDYFYGVGRALQHHIPLPVLSHFGGDCDLFRFHCNNWETQENVHLIFYVTGANGQRVAEAVGLRSIH